MYFLVGFLLVIVWKQPQPNKPQTWTDRGKLYAIAIIAGLLFTAVRFAMQKYFDNNALKKVNALLEENASSGAIPLANAFDRASNIE